MNFVQARNSGQISLALSPKVKVAITGATGWIGLGLAKFFEDFGISQKNGRLRLFGSSARKINIAEYSLNIEKLENADSLGEGEWLFFHFAFLGKEKTKDLDTDAFEKLNDKILNQTLSLCETAQSAKFLFTSSGAVYGANRELIKLLEQSPYGYMKVLHEQRIENWGKKNSIPITNVRVFNIGGPYMNKLNLYALSDFIMQAHMNGKIKIGASKPVFRSFVHIDELSYVMTQSLLTQTNSYLNFDTCGREILEISDLATTIGKIIGIDNLLIERPKLLNFEPDWYIGDGKTYQSILTNAGLTAIGIDEIISATANDILNKNAI